jgi:membrane protein YqaA with SNARE-associated domain
MIIALWYVNSSTKDENKDQKVAKIFNKWSAIMVLIAGLRVVPEIFYSFAPHNDTTFVSVVKFMFDCVYFGGFTAPWLSLHYALNFAI